MTILNLIFAIAFIMIGFVVAAFTLGQILVILSFGIPTTNRFKRLEVLKSNNHIIRRYVISMIILLTLFCFVLFLIYTFIPQMFIAFLCGTAFALIAFIGKTGANADNISSYREANDKYLTDDAAEKMTKYIKGEK